VGFAGQEWWVIGYNGTGVYSSGTDNVTLLLKSTGNPYGNIAFRTGQTSSFSNSTQYTGDNWYYANNPSGTNWTVPNEYRGSTLQQRMEAIAGTFPQKEKDAISARTLTASDDTNNQITGGDVANQKLWALSRDEWTTIGDTTVRSYGDLWWLRSPYSDDIAFRAENDGSGNGNGSSGVANYNIAARPAFNLNLSSVIFTSAAAGGKPAAVGSNLSETQTPSGKLKCTFEDSSLSLNVADQSTRTATPGGTVGIDYTGAVTGTDNYVSCVITDSIGNVLYYGKLATAASGTANITVPSGLGSGSYKIKMFNEQANGENFSDFASAPIDIPLTVPTPVTFTAQQTGGSSGTANSTGIVLTFGASVTGLTAGDITIIDGTGSATKGTLSGSGTSWTIALTGVPTQGNVNVAVADFGTFDVTTAAQSVAVYKDTRTPIAFSDLTANGTANSTDTTELTLTFSANPTTLALGDITVTGGAKGTLSGSGTTRTLTISNITVGEGEDVTVAIANPVGFTITPTSKTVAVHKATDKSGLAAALATASNIHHGGVNTTAAWTNFVNALNTATTVYGNAAATQTEVNDATNALNAAVAALKHTDNGKRFENSSGKHQIGSTDNLVHIITHDLALHTGVVRVDGNVLTLGTHYTSAEGSTRTTLLASYLNTLSVGTHTLTVEYASGTANISDTFEILAAGGNGNNNNGGSGEGGSPRTGDDMNFALLIALCGGALALLTLLIALRRKANRQIKNS
jgi:hypothetical protein